jgi:cytochrome c-type biogenesis protein CcmH/NrfG
MKSDSLAFGVAGILFGLLVGWIIGSQSAVGQPPGMPPAATATSSAGPQAAPLDEARISALKSTAAREPSDVASRVQLGNLYFDAERFADAITWYSEALTLAPDDVNVSTDLGVSFYYSDQPDRALAQFDRSLKLDPTHTKTILNMGIVKAFGKQDLEGAVEAWTKVVELAPDSPEGQAAKGALERMRAAHTDAASGGKPGI